MQTNIQEVKARLGITTKPTVPVAKISRPKPPSVLTRITKEEEEYYRSMELDVQAKRTAILLDGCNMSRRLKLLILPVLQEYDVAWSILVSPSRMHKLKEPRREIWALLREEGMSFPQIAALCNRDHTTILYGYNEYLSMKEASNEKTN